MLRIIKGFAASVVIAFLIMFSSAFAVQADESFPTPPPCSENCELIKSYTFDSTVTTGSPTNDNPSVDPNGECTNCQPAPPESQDTGSVNEGLVTEIGSVYEPSVIEISVERYDHLVDEAAAGKQAVTVAWFLGALAVFLGIVLWLVSVAKRQ